MWFLPLYTIIVTLGVLLPLLLMLYPTRCGSRYFSGRIIVKTFIEAFQGSYKDGTNGTRDYRAVSALYLVCRVVLWYKFCEKSAHFSWRFHGIKCLVYAGCSILWICQALQIQHSQPSGRADTYTASSTRSIRKCSPCRAPQTTVLMNLTHR